MTFMIPPTAASGEARIPLLSYNAKAGRLTKHDRQQDLNGVWSTNKVDVTMDQPQFAMDFGRLEIGWIHLASGQPPQFSMVFYGDPAPVQPPSPGNDEKGRPLQFRQGFRLPVAGNAIGGLRELSGSAGALIKGTNALHTQYQSSPEARSGKLPLVKMTSVVEDKTGLGTNFQPIFTTVGWIDRSEEVFGPRMVPPPAGPASPPNSDDRPAPAAGPSPDQHSSGMPF